MGAGERCSGSFAACALGVEAKQPLNSLQTVLGMSCKEVVRDAKKKESLMVAINYC